MRVIALALLLAVASAAGTSATSRSHQMRTVLKNVGNIKDTLNGIAERKQKEFNEAQVQHNKFMAESKQRIEEDDRMVEEEAENITKKNDNIAKANSRAAESNDIINANELKKKYALRDQEALNAVQAIRKNQFNKMNQHLSESNSQLNKALDVLKGQNFDRAQGFLFLQENLNSELYSKLTQEPDNDLDEEYQKGISHKDPQGEGYKSSLGGIVDLVKKMITQINSEIDEATRTMHEKTSAYESAMLDAEHRQKTAEKQIASHTRRKNENMQQAGIWSKEVKVHEGNKESADVSRQTLEIQRTLRQEIWNLDKVSRQNEIDQMRKAVSTLGSLSFMQMSSKQKVASMLQIDSKGVNAQVVTYLESAAENKHSKLLSALAVNVASGMSKDVVQMIKDMIAKLTAQAGEEAKQKAWCDNQLATNKDEREKRQQQVTAADASYNKNVGVSSQSKKAKAKAIKDKDSLRKYMHRDRQERLEDQGLNQETYRMCDHTIKTVKAAQDMLTSAQDFTAAKSGGAPGGGGATSSKGMGAVVDLLDTVVNDTQTVWDSAKKDEETEQKEFEEREHQNNMEMDRLASEIDFQEQTRTSAKKAAADARADKNAKTILLDAANQYYDKLQKPCGAPKVSFEDRMAQRQSEIESLEEALAMLTGQE